MKGDLRFPFFSKLEANERLEAFFNIVLGKRALTLDEKDVLIQIQSTIVSLKELFLENCLNTFVHDCS